MTNPAEPSLTTTTPDSPSTATVPEHPAPAQQQAPRTWMLLALVAAGMVAGAIGVILLRSPDSGASTVARAATAGSSSDSSTVNEIARATAAPKWSGGVRRSNGRNVAVYELEANNDVALWGKVVRPVLTVRCIAGTTEVFVLTQSAAAIDGNDGKHAVLVGYDRDPDGSERWLASDDYDALFAENGVGAARRIAAARTMRFGFTPYNSTPVVARFDVAGFDGVAPKLARTCRW